LVPGLVMAPALRSAMARSTHISICLAAVAIIALVACPKPTTEPARPTFERAPIRRYDLVRRGYDHNGFALNPQFGWHFNRENGCVNSDTASNPTTCSWRFSEDHVPTVTPCNTLIVDPDFSNQWSTWMFGITCSDSPMLYTGHINWGDSYRGAVTYEGWLSWDEYAPDNDYNFLLETDAQHGPSSESVMGVEIDEREIRDFSTAWFSQLHEKALKESTDTTKQFVGRREVVLTGLLGIDAEHLSAEVLHLELHPVYAMAIRTSEDNVDTDVWAVFARDEGNEGFCSHRGRDHVLQWPNQQYQVELPIRCSKAKIEATSSFCSHGNGVPEVSLTVDPQRRVSLVSVELPSGGIIEGELQLKCSGVASARARETPAPPAVGEKAKSEERRRMERWFSRTQKRQDQVQQDLSQVCRADPAECEVYRTWVVGGGSCGDVRTSPPQIESIEPPPSEPLTCESYLPPPFDPNKVAAFDASAKVEQKKPPSRPQTKRLPEDDYCDKRAKQNKTAAAICLILRHERQ